MSSLGLRLILLPTILVCGLAASAANLDPASLKANKERLVTDEDRRHWAFLPLRSPQIPHVLHTGQVRSPVDCFVVDRLAARGISQAPIAKPHTLVRRIHFDLTGLPPSPDEVDSFVREYALDSNGAVQTLIDRLLASPRYGERWARHWLDLARYADSDGQEGDADRRTAFHYRDFVIRGFNSDLPYDQFLRLQLAGDEMDPGSSDAIAATGFIVAGTHAVLPDNLLEEERLRTRFNELDDMISTTGTAMLGLTLGCARCHDHKYDPIPRRDYYRIECAFNGGDRAEVPLASLEAALRYKREMASWKKESEAVRSRLSALSKAASEKLGPTVKSARIDSLPITAEEREILKKSPGEERAKTIARKFANELKVKDEDYFPHLTADEVKHWNLLKASLKEIDLRKPNPLPTVLAFSDFGFKPRDTFLLARGDFRAKTEQVQLGFLSVMTSARLPESFLDEAKSRRKRDDSTQQRTALAEWVTDLENGAGALAARVIVNRIWQHHFGEGLVRTVNDFGLRSDSPTHPELLEWLATELVKNGWKLKPLHRLILNSSTYLQSTAFDPAFATIDPENRLLWHRRSQRLESEILRDSLLAVSGSLNSAMHGPAVKAPIDPAAIQARNMKDPYPADLKDSPSNRRRSIYLFHKRVVQNPFLQAFDGPDASTSCGRREITTVAPQALVMLNDGFVRTRASEFARRLLVEAEPVLEDRVRLAWRIALGRLPVESELKSACSFINLQVQRRSSRDLDSSAAQLSELALTDFCQAMFALNEFIYID